MKRILVTGGADFLGSHLCEKLLQAGHEVLCVDNYFKRRKRKIIAHFDASLSQKIPVVKSTKSVHLIKPIPASGKVELKRAKGNPKS